MKKRTYDLVVAYRIFPKVSKSPPIFQNNKYKLAHLCLKSFKESLGSLKVKIYALLDNCPPNMKIYLIDILIKKIWKLSN